ncbi:hypothetical protein Pcinc_010090 [Petrolisthes cinctipes]|uniref:RING-type domain-containing protein n=1 Tax=Petrolisthes cinctipes TaxID=88211 RepID=A0AAE1G3F8_PETCI|nr:hypothetical protein Pcinc_010090 [Petrolisthes cinctipes]
MPYPLRVYVLYIFQLILVAASTTSSKASNSTPTLHSPRQIKDNRRKNTTSAARLPPVNQSGTLASTYSTYNPDPRRQLVVGFSMMAEQVCLQFSAGSYPGDANGSHTRSVCLKAEQESGRDLDDLTCTHTLGPALRLSRKNRRATVGPGVISTVTYAGSMEAGCGHKMVLVAGMWMVAGLVSQCLGDILIISDNNETFSIVPDYPARFGPPVLLSGFKGYASHVRPHDACIVPEGPPKLKNYTGAWIGIVQRYGCPFDEKVINAQIAGYDAVIVHNNGSNNLYSMGIDNQSIADKIRIPSVFIGQDDAIMIIENFLYNKGFILEITSDLPFNLQNYLVPFAITIGICFIVILSFMVVKCVRDYRRSRRHRLSSRALRKLPTHKFKKGDPYECCAICLEDYVDNDKLRILPCEHAYHSKCIDPWLTKNRRVCPVCKRKVFTGDERASDLDTDSEDEGSPLINSEGGTQGGTFAPQRENPFQEAERQAEERRQQRRRRRGVSRHVECGPEGYQRLAESSEEEEDEEEEEEQEEQEGREKEEECKHGERSSSAEIEGKVPVVVGCEEIPVVASSARRTSSPRQTPTTISVVVNEIATAAASLTDTSSIGSYCSVGSQGSSPGPVQIAVDVVNSPPLPSTTQDSSMISTQALQTSLDARSERDYVVFYPCHSWRSSEKSNCSFQDDMECI